MIRKQNNHNHYVIKKNIYSLNNKNKVISSILVDNMINVSRFFLILLFYSNSLVTAARTKVVIIGAGASGIAAGSKLIENGAFDVKILEAEQRYGGRIYNLYEDGYYKALGAEW